MGAAAVALPPGFELEQPAPSPAPARMPALPLGFELESPLVHASASPADLYHQIPAPEGAPGAPPGTGAAGAAPDRSFLGDLAHATGVDARSAIEGLTGLAALPSDALFGAINFIHHLRGEPMPYTLASQSIDEGLTAAGLPEASSPTERVAGDVVGAITGAGGDIKGGEKLAELATNPIVQRIAEALAEHPARQLTGTIGGTLAADAAGAAGAPTPIAQLAGIAAGAVAGGRAPTSAEEAAAHEVPATTPVEIARRAGYKLKPTEAGGGSVAKAAEGLTGSKRLETNLVEQNQATTNQHAAIELGLDPSKPLTDQALNKAKQPFNAAYEQVGQQLGSVAPDDQFRLEVGAIGSDHTGLLPDPAVEGLKGQLGNLEALPADQAVQTVRALRRDASQNIRAPYDPERQAKGYAQQQAADAIENLLERAATAQGNPDLISNLRAARVGLAKINNVQQVLDENGNVDAIALGKMADRGAPLSGRLKIVADVARAFPSVMRNLTKEKNRSAWTVPELAYAGMEAGAPVAAGEAVHHGLAGLAAGVGTVLGRHGVRALLASDLYQNALGRVAPTLGPGSALGEYFLRPGSIEVPAAAAPAPGAEMGSGAVPFEGAPRTIGAPGPAQMLLAQRLAGALGLEPEAQGGDIVFEHTPSVGHPGELTASVPAAVAGDVHFTPSTPIAAVQGAGALELAPQASRPLGEQFAPAPVNPRAAGMAERVPGTTLHPELRAVRASGQEVGPGLSLEEAPPAPRAPLALPAPGHVAIPLSSDDAQPAQLAEALGLSPDVIRAASAHPGTARIAPARAPLALGAPAPEPPRPLVVDRGGRAAQSAEELAAHRRAMGLNELGPGVRQPAANPNPGRVAAAQAAREPLSPDAPNLSQSGPSGVIRPSSPEAAPRVIQRLVSQARSPAGKSTHSVVQYASEVHPAALEAFKQAGVDVSGYTHVLDTSAVRHILNDHGSPATEVPRGQVPITPADIAKLPEIVTHPDLVQPAGKTKIGRDAIQYVKRIGGDVVVVEEARTGRKQLAVTSMWKVARHEPMPDLGAPTPTPTSETLGGTLPPAGTPDSTTGSPPPNAAPQQPSGGGGSAPKLARQVVGQRTEPFSAHTVAHFADEATGEHILRSQNGQLTAQESGPHLLVKRIDVAPAARGKGEATAMMEQLLEHAQAQGKTVGSDISVSPEQRKVYRALANRGWDVKQNPAEINPSTKNLVSADPRVPVYEVRAQKGRSK